MISGEQQVKKEKKGEKKRNTTQILKAQIVRCGAQKVAEVDLTPKLQFCLRPMT
jgi:hypothetical protein